VSRFTVRTLRLPLLTPEHVAIHFRIADVGSRATALLLDLLIQVGFLIALGLALAVSGWAGGDVLTAVLLLAAFAVRNFYFTWSEIRWQGRTFGKRLLGLRVVARDGGPLAADLLFARNLTRELETFLPLSVLAAPESLVPGAPRWAQLATVVWALVLTSLPLFNRQRARLGDLLAGTVVVFEPKAELDIDLVEDGRSFGAVEEFTFTPEQLDVYGIRELQVLEDVLRREPSDQRDELLGVVCDKVKNKIGWDRDRWQVQPQRFLQAFYAAQRRRLEKGMLLGKRRERKVR
jgi:uncharacterized RDD family membrane protein YckC